MIVVGCTSVTQGTATIDRADAPMYRASVSASIEESATVPARASPSGRSSLTKEAVHTSCDALSSSSVDAVDAVNDLRRRLQRRTRRRDGARRARDRRAQPQR